MSVNPAALHEAAEHLSIAARAVDERRHVDAVIALEHSSLAAVTAFPRYSVAAQCWAVILEDVAAEMDAEPETVSA